LIDSGKVCYHSGVENILEVKNLSKKYGTFLAVNKVNFSVKANEIFALIGPNGAGKSTTIRMIATILSPTEGQAKIGELDIIKDAAKVREIISYLPEEAGAYKNMTGLGYLKFMASLYVDDKSRQKECVEFATNISELGERLKDKIGTYSKGMTRKILLARTVMMRPKLAILDEPTSGLDVINAMEIRQTIKKLAKEGMSVLLSSHNMLEIEYLADRIAIIEKGKICETGTAEELKKKYKASNLEEVFVGVTQHKNG
jgi:ABC-2 type transport system ATP-binding protein